MDDARPYGRRAFLGLLAGGVSALWWAEPANRIFAPISSQFSQLAGNLFPVGGWRIYTISGSMPIFDERSWRLEIDGLVRAPVSLTYDQLLALPRSEQVSDFHCVTGWSVRQRALGRCPFSRSARARRAAACRDSDPIRLAEEPYDDSLTLDQALLPNVMLAYELDGKPLSRPHGSPARVVIPEMYGYKGVKWLQRMELVAQQPTGYWEGLGYDQNAWVGRSNGYSS